METETKNTKAFYNTEIPSDWEVKELGELFDFKNGINAGKESYGKGVKFINVMEVIYHDYIFPEMIPGTVQILEEQKTLYLVKDGDVLFNRTSETVEEIGLSAVFNGNEEVVFGGFVIRGRPIVNEIDNLFKRYCLRSAIVRSQIIKGGQGAVRTNIGQGDLSKVKIPLPPLPEQRAIAKVLGAMDKAINANNQLIAQKELRKKWLMQNLLTGKKRLKGFSGEWKEVALKDVFIHKRSKAISRDGLAINLNKNVFSIHYGDIHSKFNSYFLDFDETKEIPQILSEEINFEIKDFLIDGDIIIADASEDYEGVGAAVEVRNIKQLKAIAGLHTIVLSGGEDIVAKLFRGYLLNSVRVRNTLRKFANGTSVYSVSKTTLKNLTFIIPESIEEQTAIAKILQAADKELVLLRAKSDKLKEQKKGMMQVLLTGKKRLL